LPQDILLNRAGELTALSLWESGAVKINLQTPFKLVSGNFSPIYINCREVISDPAFMSLFCSISQFLISRREISFDIAAGGETAGIPFAAFLAGRLSKPMVYVRKAVKGHGLASLIEGGSVTGKTVLLVEDLITNAGSKLHFINALTEAGGIVRDVLVLFDRQQGGEKSLAELGVRLHSLVNLDSALKVGREAEFITDADLTSVKNYLDNPEAWHQTKGLEYIK